MEPVALVVISVVTTLAVCGLAWLGARVVRKRQRPKPPPKPDWVRTVQGAVQLGVQARDRARELAPVLKDSIQSITSWFESSRPSMAADLAEDGTITILFSDIENSTTLNAELGDDRWFEELRAHTKLVRKVVDDHDGHVVKSQGDGFMIAFKDPPESVACAVDLQRALEKPRRKRERLRVRIGIHTGPAISDDGDFFGENVAMAARVAQQARGSEILVSAAVRERASDGLSFSPPREVELKGIKGRHEVFSVDWRGTTV